MTLYTSYFAKSANNPKAVSISVGVPAWYTGRQNGLVTPGWPLFSDYKKGKITQQQYISTYRDKLDKIGERKILSQFTDGDVLLCWEKPDEFCHRHILAQWLREHGHTVSELGGANNG